MRDGGGKIPARAAMENEDPARYGMGSAHVKAHRALCRASTIVITRDWEDAEALNRALDASAVAVPYEAHLLGYRFKRAVVLTDPLSDRDFVWLKEVLAPTLPDKRRYWWHACVEEYYRSYDGQPPVRLVPEIMH
jgi:hypothetical protein